MTGLRCVQIFFNVHNPVNLKILTVNPYMNQHFRKHLSKEFGTNAGKLRLKSFYLSMYKKQIHVPDQTVLVFSVCVDFHLQ